MRARVASGICICPTTGTVQLVARVLVWLLGV